MTTIVLLLVVSVLIGAFAYFTNAGFGDRRPRDKRQDSAGDDEPPPHR